MADAVAHRGPDGDGFWLSDDGVCGLAHRRLAILDVDARSDQPMLSPDSRLALIFNGEVYNFLEVREELERLGHRFVTESDTEVVLAGWREWGEALLPRLNGMFAFALYDTETRELVLVRDRFGVKPLLFSQRNNRFAFGSETRALMVLPWVDRAVDEGVARRMMYDPFSVEASGASLFGGIERLPAGHLLRVSADGGRRLTRWWRSTDHLVRPPVTLDQAAERFWELFREAVRIRMRSDVPIGTCLSGGFDSSAIAATMGALAAAGGGARQSEDWRHAFIASFPGMSNDETPEARLAANYAGIERPNVMDFSGDDPMDKLEEVLDALEDVFIGPVTAVWKTYRGVADAGVRVTLDGHGADEVMGGYRQGGQSLTFLLRNMFGNASGRSPALAGVNDALKAQFLRSKQVYFLRSVTPPPAPPNAFIHDQLPEDWGLLNRRLYGMVHATILPTLLRNFDRLSMAHGVEVRSPFLDWRLMTFVMSLPDGMKSNDRYSKLVAREAMRNRMPESIRDATRKVGFGSPLMEWMNGALGVWAEGVLARPTPAVEPLFDLPRLRARVRALNAAKAWTWDSAGRIWPYIHMTYNLQRLEGAGELRQAA